MVGVCSLSLMMHTRLSILLPYSTMLKLYLTMLKFPFLLSWKSNGQIYGHTHNI